MRRKLALFATFALPLLGPTAAAEPPDAAAARSVFERFRALVGRWEGRSTKGWTDHATIKTIAGGSVVSWSSFEAHPGEEMSTMIHLDGERLLLTHYCVSRTQPRLVLSDVTDGGRQVTFSFLDGTGMASRDRGHMDQALLRFEEHDRFSSRWTWYQDGQERWMEEIEMRRLAEGEAPRVGEHHH